MSVLSYQTIRRLHIFSPFCERSMHEETNLSYGCGGASYDVRLAEDIGLYEGQVTLASAIEYFSMPGDVCGVVHDKSSLARAGILVQNTFIDPGWRGYLTLEISYHQLTSMPRISKKLELTAGTPIAQIVLHYLDEYTQRPYEGRYQDQAKGAQPSRIKYLASKSSDEEQLERFGKVWLGKEKD